MERGPKLVADAEHLALLQQGVDAWNAWMAEKLFIRPDLLGADLTGANLSLANLTGAILSGANLSRSNLLAANLGGANLTGADLLEANLNRADLRLANFSGANLTGANLGGANLSSANLSRANLSRAILSGALLVKTNLVDATLTDCSIYGISAWGVELGEGTKQQDLIITPEGELAVTVDDLEVAQFVYLLLHNEKIRRVIDTVGKKGVLLLGRFTEGRIVVLERLRERTPQARLPCPSCSTSTSRRRRTSPRRCGCSPGCRSSSSPI